MSQTNATIKPLSHFTTAPCISETIFNSSLFLPVLDSNSSLTASVTNCALEWYPIPRALDDPINSTNFSCSPASNFTPIWLDSPFMTLIGHLQNNYLKTLLGHLEET